MFSPRKSITRFTSYFCTPLLLGVIILFNYACESSDTTAVKQHGQLRQLLLPATGKAVNTADYFELLDTLPLQLGDAPPIGHARKLVAEEDRIYLLATAPQSGATTLYILSATGQLLHAVQNSEDFFFALHIDDFVLWEDHLYLLDGREQAIHQLDLAGQLVRTRKLPFYAKELLIRREGGQPVFYFYKADMANNGEDEAYFYRLLQTDTSFQVKRGWQPFKIAPYTERTLLHLDNSLFAWDDEVIFLPGFSDTLYSLQPDSLQPYLFVDFGKQALPAASREKPVPQMLQDMRERGYRAGVSHFYAYGPSGQFYYLQGQELHYTRFDLAAGTVDTYTKVANATGELYVYPLTATADKLYAVVNEFTLAQMPEDYTFSAFEEDVLASGQTFLVVSRYRQ